MQDRDKYTIQSSFNCKKHTKPDKKILNVGEYIPARDQSSSGSQTFGELQTGEDAHKTI